MSFLTQAKKNWWGRWPGRAAAVAAAALVAACGGGGTDGGPLTCSAADEKIWLREYMDDWYFWYKVSPSPDPAGYLSVDSYFNALLYQGGLPDFPRADDWSYMVSQEAYDRTFGDGRTLGYGVMVAGIEVQGHPDWPLYIRYVEPGSPAALAGLQRGDRILTVNGKPASQIISDNNYADLSPVNTGDVVTLGIRNDDGDSTVRLTATIYDLDPVPYSRVITTPDGRKMGYVQVKDMIDQALAPFDAVFGQFKAAGVQDVILDLRYNGGGLISVADKIASFPNGAATNGKVFASLLYNDKRSGNNESFRFQNYANATGLSRVYVLTGPRTCSASEQVINGLRPYVNVVTIGDTTCGKPVGFLPQADGCGSVVNAVNFESVNSRNEGRYFDGFDATCPVAEDFSQPQGSEADPLIIAAEDHADGFGCPTLSASQKTKILGLRKPSERPKWVEAGERRGMIGR
ncbi:S41 family peptidase [Ideonella sp. DXS29W]|uniref:S41 family peptidase n=1 Tax=Ideonella lacteola TaxID=2984193 RepID=A0ABU9BN57_9BURK